MLATMKDRRDHRRPLQGALLILLLVLAMPLPARTLGTVAVTGVEGDLRANVEASLSLNRLTDRQREQLTEARLVFLMRQAETEARRALEPYGYYRATVEVTRSGEPARVTVAVQPGDPVRVVSRTVRIEGPGGADPVLREALAEFGPRTGDVFDHRRYEAGKARVERVLGERGYFAARTRTQEVQVTRASGEAVVEVVWDSGPRFSFGEVEVGEHQLRPGLIERLVPWEAGEPFEQRRLLDLQQTLADLDYFAAIDITAAHWEAEDQAVPVRIGLTPAKQSIYSAGLGYGTDSGVGVQLGFERRWVNTRGHKWANLLDWSQRRQLLTTQYRVPAFDRFAGWYTGGLSYRQETASDIDSQLLQAVASRSGQVGQWTVLAALNAQRERFRFGDFDREYATLVYPSLRAETSRGDDPLYPTRGWALSAEVRFGSEALGSSTDFVQGLAQARWVTSFGERTRLLVRGELGGTYTDAFTSLPPSLRFFAGGDRSVRGYGFKELGPRVNDVVIGGEHLAVLSTEIERMFTDTWGAAVFVDSGNAFSNWSEFDNRVGVGAGLRWRSPVGPVRVDIARGLDGPEQSFRLHINIGPDL